jgi:hypothetical protein
VGTRAFVAGVACVHNESKGSLYVLMIDVWEAIAMDQLMYMKPSVPVFAVVESQLIIPFLFYYPIWRNEKGEDQSITC